jgi:hypothetical protein
MVSGISSVEILKEGKTVVTVVVKVVGLIATDDVIGVTSMVGPRGTPAAGAGAPCGLLGIGGVRRLGSDVGILVCDVWERMDARGIQELPHWVVEVKSRSSGCNSRVATCNGMQIECIKRILEEKI